LGSHIQRQVVEVENDQTRLESNSFVAIDERMVLNEVVKVHRSQFKETAVSILPAELRFRLSPR
jgi:hypothetical protein